MKKRHPIAAALACGVAAIIMVGATNAPLEEVTIDHSGLMRTGAVVANMEPVLHNKTESLGASFDEALENAKKQADSEQAKAEAEASSEAEAEAQAATSHTAAEKTRVAPAAEAPAANPVPSPAAYEEPGHSGSSEPADAGQPADSDEPSIAEGEELASAAKTSTISIGGTEMDYVSSYGASSAPDSGAGVWMGSDSTTDGSYGYFIGHNPGSFGEAANIGTGSPVTVNDAEGNSRTYYVVDTFVVPEGSHWSDVSDRVTGHGESIALQTCVEDGYRIVVAK